MRYYVSRETFFDMATANYLSENISVNGQSVGVPSLSFTGHSELNEPFTITTDAAGAKCCVMSVWASDFPPQVVAGNLDSPLWFVKETVVQEPYASIYNGQDGQWHTVITLGNGNYIQMMRSSNDSVGHIHIKCCREDGASLSEIDTAIFEIPNQYERPFYCGITVTEGDNSLMGQIVYFGGWTASDRKYSFVLQRLLANNYNQQFFDGSIAPTYTWSPFEQLVGNNGQFRMNLSQIKEEYIGDGATTVTTQDNDKFIIEPNSSLRRISGNFPLDEERVIAWCGDNYATLTKHITGDDVGIRIKLYFDPSLPAIYDTGYMYFYDPLDDYYLSFIYDSTNQAARIDLIHYYESNGSYWWSYNEGLLPSAEDLLDIYVWLEHNGEISNTPYDTGTTDDGGDTGLPRPQDHIYTSSLPTKSGLGLGLIGLYHPTPEQLEDIADLLWSSTLIDNVLKYFSNFADNILGLYVLPFLPANLPTKLFTVGHYATDIDDVEYVTTRFYDIDMGSVPLEPLWDSYLDYEPYSRCQIYLPYIGMKDIDMDELMCPTDINGMLPKASGCTLSLLYRLDILTGSIVAQLKISNEYLTDEVRYQFSGKVGYNIPLTGETYNGIISSILNVATAGASALLSGGLTAPLVDGAAIAGTVQAQKGSVTHSGNLSGDVSMMGQKTPYIEISSPNKPYLDLQENFTGFPSYKSDQLDNFSGFTQVVEVHAEGFVCTESERMEIIRLLKEGVIL